MNPRLQSPLVLLAAVAGLVVPSVASASTHYLRPNATEFTSKPWGVVGAATSWEALNDSVTEAETPAATDSIQDTAGSREARVGLATLNLSGISVTKAQIWYYAANNQPFEVRSSSDLTWQLSNSAGWHSISQTIASQEALNNLAIRFRTTGSTTTPRQVQAAFLKIETNGPKVYWGAWMDGDVYSPGQGDAPWTATTWSAFESHAGKKVSIVHFGQPSPWQQEFLPGPLELARTGNTPLIGGDGAFPLVDMGTGCKLGKTCEGNESVAEEEANRASLSEINAGKYDGYYKAWAEGAAKYKYPFFFRWAWEMNGSWFKWGRDAAKNPAEYVQAWRHIHDLAVAAGATNITWVWCPNVDYLGSSPVGPLYPGDAYVDWSCLDGYNEGSSTFEALFKSSYSNLTGSVAPSKPLMIGETATTDGGGHMDQGNWIHEGLGQLPTQFPKIKALVWFNWNIVEKGKEWEWPIESTSGGQAAFANEISSPYFSASEFGEPPFLQPIKPLP
jgi:Glycosyl hydrolase family 26